MQKEESVLADEALMPVRKLDPGLINKKKKKKRICILPFRRTAEWK